MELEKLNYLTRHILSFLIIHKYILILCAMCVKGFLSWIRLKTTMNYFKHDLWIHPLDWEILHSILDFPAKGTFCTQPRLLTISVYRSTKFSILKFSWLLLLSTSLSKFLIFFKKNMHIGWIMLTLTCGLCWNQILA